MVAVYLATLGPMGLKKISEICYHRAHYLSNEISKISGFKIISKNFFNEFVTEVPMNPKIINEFLYFINRCRNNRYYNINNRSKSNDPI